MCISLQSEFVDGNNVSMETGEVEDDSKADIPETVTVDDSKTATSPLDAANLNDMIKTNESRCKPDLNESSIESDRMDASGSRKRKRGNTKSDNIYSCLSKQRKEWDNLKYQFFDGSDGDFICCMASSNDLIATGF